MEEMEQAQQEAQGAQETAAVQQPDIAPEAEVPSEVQAEAQAIIENETVSTPEDSVQAAAEPEAEVVSPEAESGETAQEKTEPKWYIVQTLTGQEDKVRDRIQSSIEQLGLQDKVFRVLLPEEETVEIKGDKRIERKRKMYPGYVFVEMALDEDTWYKIRSTSGVARFIGGKTAPQAVSDREMQRVLKQLGIKEKEFTVQFEIGEPIRIISGSFRGYTGSVSEINAAKSKLKAMINIFGRDTSVEVDFDRVEKVI